MLQKAYLLAKIGADTAENERNFANIWPKIGNYPMGRLEGPARPSARAGGRSSASAADSDALEDALNNS